LPNATDSPSFQTSQTHLLDGFNALGHGVAIWSSQNKLVSCNIAFRNQFQCDGVELITGLDLQLFLKKIAHSGLVVLSQQEQLWISEELLKTSQCISSEYAFGDGTTYQIERWALPEGGFITMAQDITVAKQNDRLLQKAHEKANTADKTKSRFLRAANHDLRQPLASLKILIYNCMSAEDEENRAHLLHSMDVSVSIMEDILGALLNIGQLDAGQVAPRVSTFQLSTLLERLEVELGHVSQEKGLNFRLVPSKFAIVSDRVLLERIVSNLVSNALRYTEIGGVIVGCRRDGKSVRIEVRDSGRGIEPKHMESIFNEFFRIENEQAYKKHSLGLGLNIAKRLSEILGHQISVRSEFGKGSVFSIKVPLGDVRHSEIGEPEINERIGGEFMGLSVLILEDDNNLRQALTELLERWGINVLSLNDYEEVPAFLKSLEVQPDFILTDYRLGGGAEGTEIVKQVRICLDSHCPTIVMTADTNPQLIDSIRKNGFPVLIKPVSPPRLRVMMHNVLYEPELVQELHSDTDA
jgi:signal transduction histidine kinase/CheY-like chemotaxis protein